MAAVSLVNFAGGAVSGRSCKLSMADGAAAPAFEG